MNDKIFFLTVALLVLGLMLIGPLALIWSLNTLFPALAIPYTIGTWLAAAVLGMVLTPNVKITKKG